MNKQVFGLSVLLLTLLGGTAASAATPGTFQPVGDMTTPRTNPTATLLNDGTVLVTGGWKRDASGANLVSQSAAERFDPQTNTFSPVGSMAYARVKDAAVRLQDGRVLVVGGSNDNIPATNPLLVGERVATAELYDPATGKFSTTGDLIDPRVDFTATLLPNGKVLVAGGWNGKALDTAELFDPATGKFSATGSMTTPRVQHAAVALPDGRVAILGGVQDQNKPQQSVEIYDPSAGTFSPAGQMVEGRAQFQATLLPDGRVLATGGSTAIAADGVATVLSSVEIYDPATGQSTVTDHMADPRFNHGAVTLSDGRVLVVGGAKSSTTNLATAELIDALTGKVSPTGSMGIKRVDAVPTLLSDGRVLVIGGQSKIPPAEVYVP